MERERFNNYLTAGLKKFNIAYQPVQLDLLWEYMSFLIKENRKYNLTAIEEPEEIIIKHFFDSLAPASLIDFESDIRMIDVGTGAGFPGLVIKILYPTIKLTLLDSLLKRVNFLKLLTARLGLEEIDIIHSRAEDLGQNNEYREKFDLAVSRAVAAANILSEYTLPLVREGGSVLLYKGPNYLDELTDAEDGISLLGGEITNLIEIDIPGLDEKRYLIQVKKRGKTPVKYPRRAGIPKKRPL